MCGMSITINGEAHEIEGRASVAELLERLGLAAQGIALARNATVVPSERYAQVQLEEGDRIEIIRAVAGG